jgi:hypothetical protein
MPKKTSRPSRSSPIAPGGSADQLGKNAAAGLQEAGIVARGSAEGKRATEARAWKVLRIASEDLTDGSRRVAKA